ncbi:hypothetical protein BGW80DRAFT_1278535 [Lactifluus volemus]|nr:hypothetical protein BGW80DRAFT_1278535 [Lactifluus volemus]
MVVSHRCVVVWCVYVAVVCMYVCSCSRGDSAVERKRPCASVWFPDRPRKKNSVEPGRRRVTSCVIWKTNRLAGHCLPTVYHNITLTSCPHLLTVCLLCLPTSGSCHSVRIQKFGTSYVTARVYLCPSSPGLCSTGLSNVSHFLVSITLVSPACLSMPPFFSHMSMRNICGWK